MKCATLLESDMKKIYVSGFYWSNGGGEYTIPVYHAAEVDKQIEELVELLEWIREEREHWIFTDEDLMRIDEAIKKVRG